MFTGLVEEVGRVAEVRPGERGRPPEPCAPRWCARGSPWATR